MAWSLETRVPFMDTVVAGFAFSLPARHKVRGFSKKRLLRKAVEPLLPAEVVHGRKRGFSIPAAAWLRGELEPFARETLAPEVLGGRATSGPRRWRACSTTTSRDARTCRASSGGCSRSRSGTSATSRASRATPAVAGMLAG